MKHVVAILFAMATITIHYGAKQLTIVGPADDAFCIARSTALKLRADTIDVPTGTYQAVCPEVLFDPKLRWIPADAQVAPPQAK